MQASAILLRLVVGHGVAVEDEALGPGVGVGQADRRHLAHAQVEGVGDLGGAGLAAVAAGGALVVDVGRRRGRRVTVQPLSVLLGGGDLVLVSTRTRGLRSSRRMLISMPQEGGHILGK